MALNVSPTTVTMTTELPQPIEVTDLGFNGQLTAMSSNTSIAAVTPPAQTGPGPVTFQITALANGSCTITVSDTMGPSVQVQVTVSPATSQTYNEYTTCVQPANYSGPFLGSSGFWGALAASIVAGFFDPAAGIMGFAITGILYCRWWLYGRLVCLGGNQCFIGLALECDTAADQSGMGKLDTDYSIKLLPAPSPLVGDPYWLQNVPATNTIQGFLIEEQGFATGALALTGPPNAGDTLNVTVGSSSVTYTCTSTDTTLSAASALAATIGTITGVSASSGLNVIYISAATAFSVSASTTGASTLTPSALTLAFPNGQSNAAFATMMQNFSSLSFDGEAESSYGLVNHDGTSVLSAAQALSLNLPIPPQWQANYFYTPGDQIEDSNGNIQACTPYAQALSGANAPNWPTTIGATVYDGSVQWQCGGPVPSVTSLEVEFEGAGVWDLYQALIAAAAVAGVGAVFCLIPIIGWIVCLILSLVALAIAGIGAGVALSDDSAENQANSQVGVIHPGQDVLFVLGRWVYDSAHTGWNELHPVLFCQRIAQVPQPDLVAGQPWQNFPDLGPQNLQATVSGFCGLANDALSPLTFAAQLQPQNQWTIHPLVDGCTTDVGGPPPSPLQ
jgi:hypothetical protein